MNPRRQLSLVALELADVATMIGSFGLATWVVAFGLRSTSLADFLAMRLKVTNFVVFIVLLILWHLLFRWFGLYESRRLSSSGSEILDVLKAVSVGAVLVLNAGFLLGIALITPTFVLVFWAASTIFSSASRLAVRMALRRLRSHGHNLNYVLIVGTNSRALRVAEKLRERAELGVRIIGFLDEDWHGLETFEASGEVRVGKLSDLRGFLRDHVVDEVVIALPMSSCYRQAATIVRRCEQQGVTVRLMSDIFNLDIARAHLDVVDGEPIITLRSGKMQGVSMTVKRALDFVLALVQLLVLSPLFLVVAILIKLTSPGPVFFAQERIGLNRRKFRLLKFRTMVADAEDRQQELEHLNEASGPVFKIVRDPRLTSLGKVLRRTSIDELPQLINVLKGDMSLVGPRPLPVRDYDNFGEDWHRRRFSVRPGLTCLWQVSGRSSLPFEKWMELDMRYIDQWSFWLDLRILVQTIPAVLRGSGAF